MGYIINLTILLKGLFQGLHSERQAVRRVIMADSIDTVVDAYEQSGERAQRHRDIDESVPHPSCIFSPGHRRKRLQEIFRLIEIYVLHRGMQHKVGHGHSEGPGLHAFHLDLRLTTEAIPSSAISGIESALVNDSTTTTPGVGIE
ncbi:hypothetical protein FRB95_001457 [Tulasnella sp. JGI-2019a]|nr:hypothetical protein FRB95_001457 [Tulasnella sp. JGI-2019a]